MIQAVKAIEISCPIMSLESRVFAELDNIPFLGRK
jgi:hypothetical protein